MEQATTMTEEFLSADEAAKFTTLKAETLRKMAWTRRIRSYKVLGALRFRKSDLEALIVERRAEIAGCAAE